MKKTFFALIFFSVSLFTAHAQADVVFSTVPVVNNMVVFEYFIHSEQELSADQKYAQLQQWGNAQFRGNPMVSGIRFDDRTRTMTVSLRTELALPSDETITMHYRFDVSVTAVGGMVVIRDISYQQPAANGSIFPTTHTAEQMITDQAVAVNDDNRMLRNNVRRTTLVYFNRLVTEIAANVF